ncbi:hypothetical protein EGP99_02715 [bacterium]|nr:hypothetical protein [bacterium]
MKLSKDLAKKQVVEKISLELVYEFLILDNEEMNVIKVEDINLIEDNEYMELVDEAIAKLNQKTNLDLIRKDGKIYLGNCN